MFKIKIKPDFKMISIGDEFFYYSKGGRYIVSEIDYQQRKIKTTSDQYIHFKDLESEVKNGKITIKKKI